MGGTLATRVLVDDGRERFVSVATEDEDGENTTEGRLRNSDPGESWFEVTAGFCGFPELAILRATCRRWAAYCDAPVENWLATVSKWYVDELTGRERWSERNRSGARIEHDEETGDILWQDDEENGGRYAVVLPMVGDLEHVPEINRTRFVAAAIRHKCERDPEWKLGELFEMLKDFQTERDKEARRKDKREKQDRAVEKRVAEVVEKTGESVDALDSLAEEFPALYSALERIRRPVIALRSDEEDWAKLVQDAKAYAAMSEAERDAHAQGAIDQFESLLQELGGGEATGVTTTTTTTSLVEETSSTPVLGSARRRDARRARRDAQRQNATTTTMPAETADRMSPSSSTTSNNTHGTTAGTKRPRRACRDAESRDVETRQFGERIRMYENFMRGGPLLYDRRAEKLASSSASSSENKQDDD